MGNLFRAFFFKLRKDLTFRITLIVGAAVAILMMVIFLVIDYAIGVAEYKFCTGQTMFLVSFTPTSNFGLAIPINLITFTVLEFSHGIIRNKIIAGNSKFKIYLGLFLSGLVFALSLLLVYAGLCTLLGTICGGFDANGITMAALGSSGAAGICTPEFIGKTLLVAILIYVSITSFTVFVSTLLRNVGPSIPLTIMPLIILAIIGPVVYAVVPESREALMFLNPIQVLANPTLDDHTNILYIGDLALTGAVVSNLVYTGLFFGFGALIFVKRDVK